MGDLRVEVRAAEGADEPFLRAMLYEAATWDDPPDRRAPIDDVLARPRTARYVEGWPRAGDAGVVAEVDGEPAGAAWYRFLDLSAPGYGFVDATIPEVTIGVVERLRGRGVGRALLDRLQAVARAQEVAALSLSVEEANPALRLYERCGFARRALVDGAWTMVAKL